MRLRKCGTEYNFRRGWEVGQYLGEAISARTRGVGLVHPRWTSNGSATGAAVEMRRP